jgi:glutathione S-transferase
MHELILHHYDFSPFSEKIRLIFGVKALAWRSVTIASVMPKPDLIALTGGYRHTPVLQIGADIFCDTRLIARELERRYPQPPLLDEQHLGVALAIEAWAERDLFWPVVRYVSGINAEQVAPDLHADRAAMRGKHPPSIARLRAFAEANLSLVEAQLPRVENIGAKRQAVSARQCARPRRSRGLPRALVLHRDADRLLGRARVLPLHQSVDEADGGDRAWGEQRAVVRRRDRDRPSGVAGEPKTITPGKLRPAARKPRRDPPRGV